MELSVTIPASDRRTQRFITIVIFSNIDIMTPTTNALLVCVIFLCGLEETVLSQHGLCEGNQCFAIFLDPMDFSGAQQRCKSYSGELIKAMSTHVSESLVRGLRGSYWLEPLGNRSTADKAARGRQNCTSVSAPMGLNVTVQQEPCQKKLNGFLCQFTLEEPCSAVQAGGGAQVKYITANTNFEVRDSEVFPQGTTAVVVKIGDRYPDTKHICFGMKWLRAPWNCEVLGGGCEYGCNSTSKSCICPALQTLHPNGITCIKGPCADCAQQCHKEGNTHVCRCEKGYRLAKDRKNCVDVNECEENSPCTGEGEECENTKGSYECKCKDGYVEEDGKCVDISICMLCEHLDCEKSNGVYECQCRKGYRVSPKDPTKCEMVCTVRDCLARCIPQAEGDPSCFCPEGYVQDLQNNTVYCTDINECDSQEHCPGQRCENLFGSFRCVDTEDNDDDGSGSAPLSSPAPPAPPASAQPAALPSYVKTGSILGITLFFAMSAVLLCCAVRYVVKRCGKLELSSFKRPDMDIFYLQQVTTETYKRLSFDKQFKNDSQRL